MLECLFSGAPKSAVLRDDRGRFVEDELGEARCLELRAVNLNR